MFRIFTVVLGLFLSSMASAYEFNRSIKEIQILSDRVRINVGTTYGTCGENEGWWGWMNSNPASSNWLSLALTAQAQGKNITVYDQHGSCAGIGDGVGLEGVYLKTTN